MEVEDWASSFEGTSDSEVYLPDLNDEEHYYTSGHIPKLQFRKDISKACWKEEMGMAEIVEKRGRLWTTTGIIRNSKVYCLIEETLFLVEIGALLLLDDNDTSFSLKDLYEKIAEGRNGCCWESFQVYRHLKSLGYIVGRHGVPWTMKCTKNHSVSAEGMRLRDDKSDKKSEDSCIAGLFNNMEISEVKLIFDVYLPNSKFKKSSPGSPNFMLCLTRCHPPSKEEIEGLERQCNGIPIKFYHLEHGRVSFFSFNRVELPMLP
ncbi:uncharacterized protein LOC131167316 isoform X2 [Malania oleifera]|uniref:uncharacterized protein LOC131167316 isoform X2 n=1 Tax=Malania oleifera TaxID=397392 RepID=UPI0025AE8B33|nr:uncharacterized protein LOC131167316 isoform X2 [Malania oleifera]XP_057982062.1 uncharacterized protein LOC131167316 isoform X2 [Malania oleifera]